jgi:prepilin-type N-terminal cleavage/methylation domain-containing protein
MEETVLLNKKGMTLIEIMFALVILLISSLALMQTATLGISMNVQNALRDEAVNVADMEMNYLRSQLYDNIDSAATTTAASRNFRGFTVDYTITPSVQNIIASSQQSKQITVKVEWSYRNKDYKHEITTLLRKY